ncbi:hypothetical protein [Aminipila terrae]|uniref:Uncharacterized protein n=1 Tax=Aminipila terrae TaxID=2697030 RepID=A0A6P1MF95_9FIRM|nr:hypothetical protein [Aminipila terrae]QHI72577.1 hypothetical protein Ami3637_09360 [Aminipila terrae]
MEIEEIKQNLQRACKLESDIFIMQNYQRECQKHLLDLEQQGDFLENQRRNFGKNINSKLDYSDTKGNSAITQKRKKEAPAVWLILFFIVEYLGLAYLLMHKGVGSILIYSVPVSLFFSYISYFNSKKASISKFCGLFAYCILKYLIFIPMIDLSIGIKNYPILIPGILSLISCVVLAVLTSIARRMDISEWNSIKCKAGLENVQRDIAQLNSHIESYDSKFEELIKPLENASNELRELYKSGWLHPKYQNIISVHKIYEYFDTKRVTEFEGPYGAYNIFEKEIRLDNIQSSLNKVNENLSNLVQIGTELIKEVGGLQYAVQGLENAIKNQNINVVVNIDGYTYPVGYTRY